MVHWYDATLFSRDKRHLPPPPLPPPTGGGGGSSFTKWPLTTAASSIVKVNTAAPSSLFPPLPISQRVSSLDDEFYKCVHLVNGLI